METRKLKILCTGKKGILLPTVPETLSELYELLARYYKTCESNTLITFSDLEGDECMITDQITYQTALDEFTSKVTLKLRVTDSFVRNIGTTLNIEGKQFIPFFKRRTRMMGVFDLEEEKLDWVKFPEGIVFKEYAAWITLPNGEIFYSGGGHPLPSAETFIINPFNQTVKKMPNMTVARHSHALAYYDGAVYAFGGYHNIFIFGAILSKTERFILDEEIWEEITEMECARADVGAAVVEDDIFLIGKGNNFMAAYDSSNNVRIDMREDEGGCIAAVDRMLYVFQGTKIKICDPSNSRVVNELDLPKKSSWWSHCPPVVCNEKIYFLWWEEPEYICSFDIPNNKFTILLKLQ